MKWNTNQLNKDKRKETMQGTQQEMQQETWGSNKRLKKEHLGVDNIHHCYSAEVEVGCARDLTLSTAHPHTWNETPPPEYRTTRIQTGHRARTQPQVSHRRQTATNLAANLANDLTQQIRLISTTISQLPTAILTFFSNLNAEIKGVLLLLLLRALPYYRHNVIRVFFACAICHFQIQFWKLNF